MLVLGLLTLEQKTDFLQSWVLLLIGDASYSNYLSHTFTISIANKLFGLLHVSPASRDSAPATLVVIAACVMGGLAVYNAVELPILKLARQRATAPTPSQN